MRAPPTLVPLVEMGIIETVVRPLMSGKEAQLYVVIAGGEERVAKVYKEATERSFRQRADYTEGRTIRSSRDRRAISSRSKHGRAQDEAAWRSAEVDVIYRLQNAGVRVPVPHNFVEGVLVMELVAGEDGQPAPRLADVSLTPEAAREVYDHVLRQAVQMLCAGVVHGDLSEFNILMGAGGPVVIDFPQAVDAARNSSARSLLIRDVDNLHRFVNRATGQRSRPFAQEMWQLYERNELTPETQLRGQFRDKRGKVDTEDVLDLISDAERDERRRRQAQGQGKRRRGRSAGSQGQATGGPKVEQRSRGRVQTLSHAVPTTAPDTGGAKRADPTRSDGAAQPTEAPTKKRRRRRRRRRRASEQAKPDVPARPPGTGSRRRG